MTCRGSLLTLLQVVAESFVRSFDCTRNLIIRHPPAKKEMFDAYPQEEG
jgi:hypothetical protein